MRAMLASFLTHLLWQPWQLGAPWLAKLFLDFEPGIHYPQWQMQAGVTGINTVRIYNPVKQGQDNDPQGIFVKNWVPELRNVPEAFIHEPWKLSEMEQQLYGVVIAMGGHEGLSWQSKAGKTGPLCFKLKYKVWNKSFLLILQKITTIWTSSA
ncbi:MAG: FAD-binding domain-containing protein [Saprospiraceae bacterium]|nr:FAD-binding domain-containing protein [Saprospiraceae bacterium]